jgi:chemotaxis protein MotB
MPRRDNHSNHDQENHERWLVSYADFITLLFAFFVVMYSISSVNEGKYKVLSETLIGAFNVPEKASSKPEAINLKEYQKNSMIDFPGRANKDGDITSEIKQKGEGSGSALDQLSQQVEAAFADLIEDDNIAINGNETWVEISLNSSLLFASGSARPSERAIPIIRQVADILGGYENSVHVEGFTDDVPINTDIFPSNWELSAARSATVVRLLAEAGVDPDRLAAVGYGEFQPKATNATVEGRNTNRRVVLVVSRDLNVRRSVSGVGELGANTERELLLKDAEEKRSSFLKEKNRVKSVELEGGGILFTQDDKK